MSQNSVLDKCAGCTKLLPKREYLRCAFCRAAYDLECANVSSERYYAFYALEKQRKDSWKCPECQSKEPKMGNTNTPVRLTFQDDLEHHTTEKASANQRNTQNVTVRTTKPCQRVEDETEENNLQFNLNLIEDLDGKKVIAGDIMAELKLFANEMKSTRVEMSMFRETVF